MKRREFLERVGAAGAAASLLSDSSGAQQRSSADGLKIDVHNHYYPESYFQKIRDIASTEYSFDVDATGTTIIKFRGARFFGIQPPMTDPGLRLEAMDRAGIDVQVMSLSVPNVFFSEVSAEPEIARIINDGYADLIARHPTRFKGFASIPMSQPDEALKELRRALEELKLNGVILLSNIRGRPLTDPGFRPFFEEANRVGLCILIHPMMPANSGEQFQQYVLGPICGFMFDSTLAVARMCYDGLFRDFPDIKFIIPHLGGTIPYLMARLDRGYKDFVACRARIDEPPSTYLKRLYYGTVSTNPYTVDMVRDMFGTEHIALGTDFPHLLGSIDDALATVDALRIPEREKQQIYSGTAMSILNNV